MTVKKSVRTLLASAGVVAGVVVGPAAPAYADPSEYFNVCDPTCSQWTEGRITWHNRTATVTGWVYDITPGAYTNAYFEAFAGSTKVDSETRAANDESSLGWERGFTFSIGDPDRVGGINRIKITVCVVSPETRWCGTPQNYNKND